MRKRSDHTRKRARRNCCPWALMPTVSNPASRHRQPDGLYCSRRRSPVTLEESGAVQLEAVATKCPAAFSPEGAAYRLLRDDPDRYIFDSLRKGVDRPLPQAIAAGLDDVTHRDGWN